MIVLVDKQGARRLAAAASWSEAGAGVWSAGPKVAGNEASRHAILESALFGRGAKETVEGFADPQTAAERSPGAEDDPPPPEEEEESGGIGTAMALEEGRMGRKPSSAAAEPPRGPLDDRPPGRYARVVGEVSNAKLVHVPAVVIADPATRAAAVVEAVSELEAMIGVWSEGQLHPLRIQFHRDRDHERLLAGPWFDLELAAGLTIAGKPVELAALGSALADQRRRDPKVAVDLLVGPDVDAQRLIDTLVALDRAGATTIGLGLVPTDAERKANQRGPDGQPNTNGNLDKALIRNAVRQQLPKITYCYEKELLAVPNLQGTVTVQFFITPNGNVAMASGSGMNPTVAACVAAVIKGMQFPKPQGGGGVQVNYPFTFRPEAVKP